MKRIAVVLLSLSASALAAQRDSTILVRGTLRSAAGAPVAGANVFVLETLDGALTDSAGRFSFATSRRDMLMLAARHIGFAPLTRAVLATDAQSVDITLVGQASALGPITVQAGAYTAGLDRGAVLTPIQVATTPGATADIARAIQTLPGVQNVDEGTGLFVRGGDVSETKVYLNDAAMLSPYNYETPTGNFTVTVNPFLLDGIFFSSGGFGVRFGNVLSGVADLRTQGRPARSGVTAAAGLANASTGFDIALPHGLGIRATAGHSDTDLLFKVNGESRGYTPPPRGDDVSASLIWAYRPTAEVKTFAITRTNHLGLDNADPLAPGYESNVRGTTVQGGWKDVLGPVAASASASYADAHRDEGYGSFALGSVEHWSQAFSQLAWSPLDQYTLRVGGDAEWREAHIDGSLPASRNGNTRPTTLLFDEFSRGNHAGTFAEADWHALERLRLIGGVRSDYSSFTRERTVDPRASLAIQLTGAATVTAAYGGYHQVAEPLYYTSAIGTTNLPPMFARQAVVGAQIGREKRIARVELYDKRYDELVGLDHDKKAIGRGTGFARGADVFLKRDFLTWLSTRVSYSYVDAQRTDPTTHIQARAPFDITHSLSLIADQALPAGWSVSGALRYATGKPFTPITGATFDKVRRQWMPQFGAPESERLPAAARIDLSVSRAQRLSGQTLLVYYASVNNLMNRYNVYQYAYNADYTQRIAVRSLFNRSFYVGGTISYVSLQ